ncbi:MAG: hypothetical protein BGP12_01550 [Rhodospirillales bacterium 70-18]|nr:hypothetical protein [Rhodospirillales bacterium]OJY76210.1 MAG: hypothetical protein BGP12_01550 [Rhodospirillales bacterium 70-18]
MKALAIAALLAALPLAAHAADKTEAETALAAAVKAEDAAGQVGNRWVPAEAALKAAKAALAAGAWDKAVAEAAVAQAMANRAVEQSHEQETAWRDAVVR